MLPEAPAPPHRNARRPPCSLAKRGGDNDFPPPRKFAQGVDILAQDSLLLPYLPAAAGEVFHKSNSAVRSRRMNCAIAPRCCFCGTDRKSTRLNSSHQIISYAVFCLK